MSVERRWLDVEQVPGAHGAQRRPTSARSQPDGAAQVRHLHLQGVDGIGQHLLAPDLLDEGVGRSHLPRRNSSAVNRERGRPWRMASRRPSSRTSRGPRMANSTTVRVTTGNRSFQRSDSPPTGAISDRGRDDH